MKIHELKKPPAPFSFSFLSRLVSRKGDFGVGELVPWMALFSLHTINKQRGGDFGAQRHQNACAPEALTTEMATPLSKAWVIKSIALKCEACIIGAMGHYQAAETGLLLHLSAVW